MINYITELDSTILFGYIGLVSLWIWFIYLIIRDRIYKKDMENISDELDIKFERNKKQLREYLDEQRHMMNEFWKECEDYNEWRQHGRRTKNEMAK